MVIQDLKLFVVGIGSIGRRHSDVLYNMLQCKNIILWDPVFERAAEHAANYPGMQTVKTFEEGLDAKPDVVFICSPPALHMKQAESAIKAGCHVMIEKPVALDTDSLNIVDNLAKQNNRMVSVALCNRYHKGIKHIKEIAESGKIGKIINIRAVMGEFFPESRPDYLQTYYVKYNGCLELIHAVDYTLWIAGGQPEKIYGICSSDGDVGFESPDSAEIIFRTDKNVTCSVKLSFCQVPNKNALTVYGTNGTCELVYTNDEYTLRTYTRESGCWTEEHFDGLFRNMLFAAEDGDLLESIINNEYKGCNLEDAARAVKVYHEIYGKNNPTSNN